MQTTIQFLNYLQSLDVSIWLEEGKLRFRAPADRLTAELKAQLSARKLELVNLLRQGQVAEGPKLVRMQRDGNIPLTFAQQRLWFLDQLQPGVPSYNMYDVISINHELDVAALQQAVSEMVRRHELLRTSFPSVDGVPRQCIFPAAEFPLSIVDLSGLPAQEREQEAHRLAIMEAKAPFDIESTPPLRVTLIQLGRAQYIWLLSIHHIISDDWSKKLLNQELEILYTAYRDSLSSPLAELPIQWADFAIWQRRWLSGANLDAHVSYWKKQLEGELPSLNFAADHPRRELANGRSGKFFFPASLSASLRDLCEVEGVTLFMVLLAGYAALLARYTRQDDFIIGSPISDRQNIETEGLMGFFLNTLPLRVRVSEDASFRDLLVQVKETCLGAYSYSAVPYENLMQDLLVERTTSGNPLFQTMLVLLNTPSVAPGSSALWGPNMGEPFRQVEGEFGIYVPEETNGTTKFDLSLTLIEHQDGIWGKTEYNADIFDETSIVSLIERYQIILRAAAIEPERKLSELPLMTAMERAQMLESWSKGPKFALDASSLQQWVERQALLNPGAIAIDDKGVMLSYGELNTRANRLSHLLCKRGIGLGVCVGVLLERSADMFVAILSVLKAGAAYVPLDITYPSERLRSVVEDAGIALLISTEARARDLALHASSLICLKRDASIIASESCDNPRLNLQASNLACVLYTSGSTGRPKGVALTHQSLINYVEGAARDYGISSSDRVLQFASIAFDASIEDSFVTFSRGATLVLRPEGMIDSTAAFVSHCEIMKLTVVMLPTAYWHELVASLDTYPLPSLIRCVVIGGERAISEKLAHWQRVIGSRIQLFNTYGPTEASIAVTRALLPDRVGEDFSVREVTIGRPVANSEVYVLNSLMQPVPQGIPGEVYLGGAALARGYLNRPELTLEKFIPNPFAKRGNSTGDKRLYRTGDMARWLADGNLEFLGRIDQQVKIRGFRIELGEIENALSVHADVKDAVVLAKESTSDTNNKRLAAYVVTDAINLREEGEASESLRHTFIERLRQHLSQTLPAYMVPSAFVLLDSLPLTANGKVDRKILPEPSISNVQAIYVAPRTETEKVLCEIWQEVLGVARVGITDNFFQLGGHSLLATRLVALIAQSFNTLLPLQKLFSLQTIELLSDEINANKMLSNLQFGDQEVLLTNEIELTI